MNDLKELDLKDKIGRSTEVDGEQFDLTINFTNQEEKPLKLLMLDTERGSKFFTMIKKLLPHREKYYCKLSFENDLGEISELEEGSDDADEGFLGGILCNHAEYIATKNQDESAKYFQLEVSVAFFPKKNINLQVFATKISDENKFRCKSFLDSFLKENSTKILAYNIIYNNSYFTITKDDMDILIIIADETFVEEVMKNDFDAADIILFWTEINKAKDLLKKYPKKIKVCHNKFDFLLTPRYFHIIQ